MSKRKVNEEQELKDSAKLAQIDILAQRYHISQADATALKNKYGPYAYDIITLAKEEPQKLMKRINQKSQSFEDVISYFAKNNLSTETLAKAINQNELKIQSVLAQYTITKQTASSLPKEISLDELIRITQNQQKLERATDDKTTSKTPAYREVKTESEPVQTPKEEPTAPTQQPTTPTVKPVEEVPVQTPTPPTYHENESELKNKPESALEPSKTEPSNTESSEPAPTPAPTRNIKNMTPKDYSLYCAVKDKPAASYKALEDAAYKDFCIGEGVSKDLYLDCNGHVTIGCGHLVLHTSHLKNPKALENDKTAYINMPLKNSKGMPYTAKLKSEQFDKLVTAMRNKTLITQQIPNAGQKIVGFKEKGKTYAFGKLDDSGVRQMFNQDFRQFYDRVKIDKYNRNRKICPEFDNFPLPVQLEVLHTLYTGKISDLYREIQNNPNDLTVIHQAVDTIRNPNAASWGERQTIKAAEKCIATAQENYLQNKVQNPPSQTKIASAAQTKRHTR